MWFGNSKSNPYICIRRYKYHVLSSEVVSVSEL